MQPAYINYYDIQVGADPLESYYGSNTDWLQGLKTELDPTNLFTANPLAIPALAGMEAGGGGGSSGDGERGGSSFAQAPGLAALLAPEDAPVPSAAGRTEVSYAIFGRGG